MDWPVVVALLLGSHVTVLGIGFYAGMRFSTLIARRRAERRQQVPETHRRNGRNGR